VLSKFRNIVKLKDYIMALREGGNEGEDRFMSQPAFARAIGWDFTPDPTESTKAKIEKARRLADLFNAHLSKINPGSAAINGALNEKTTADEYPYDTLF
jgi:hypothetical protein